MSSARSLVCLEILCILFNTAWAGEPPKPDDGNREARRADPKPDAPPPKYELPVPAPTVTPAPRGTPAERQAWLRSQIDQLLQSPALKTAKVGLAVVDVETGRVLYARNEKTVLNPASNAKLVTTAAALAQLGPEYRFKTVLYADTLGRDGTVQGNLYLKGFGDPSLTTGDLWKLVADLGAIGVRRVTGDLVIDDTFFDNARLPPAFDQKEEDAAYRALSGAASINYNAVAVTVLPAALDGAPARVLLDPPTPYFVLDNRARTTTRGQPALLVTTAPRGEQTLVTVTGKILRGSEPRIFSRRVAHPDLYLGWTIRQLIERKSIRIGGKGPVVGATPAAARPLASRASAPLSVLIRDVNKRSNNFMAEQILKTLGAELFGRPGTWQKGLDGVGRYLEQIGIAKASYQMTNGSGLYDADRLSPQQIVQVLRQAYRDFRMGADFAASLAVAGADGTVVHRMEGSSAQRYVRVKTGTLEKISCLSGYAGAPNRPPVAFSILMNDVPEPAAAEARRVEDAIAELLVTYLDTPTTGK